MQKAVVKKTTGAKKAKGEERARPAQYRFLTELAKERTTVAIFLVNGLKLEGKIASFDDYAILLEGEMSDHVYKHAISTIQPQAGAGAPIKAGAKAGAARAPLEIAVSTTERKPRQPTIVVRPRCRLVKSDSDKI